MGLKRYSRKEPLVFVWVMIPYILIMNMVIYGSCIWRSVGDFASTFFSSGVYFLFIYLLFGIVAVFIRNRIPAGNDLFRRISVMLPVFYLMNIGSVAGLLALSPQAGFISCEVKPHMYWWAVLFGCILSTTITFINEGMANWEHWKNSLAETEKLKNAYQRSKLLGLKGQINPHFLFNCFNTLSGLIGENEDKAERFLDEMSRVHRYLLRNDDELLVPLAEELKFARSYLYLTEQRFGAAITASINIDTTLQRHGIPPLSMQVILENIIYTNAISKKNPLMILIEATPAREIVITHSVFEKTVMQHLQVEEGLDNLLNKYKLLNAPPVRISEDGEHRSITLPLFDGTTLSI
jgi:hypothetical protein